MEKTKTILVKDNPTKYCSDEDEAERPHGRDSRLARRDEPGGGAQLGRPAHHQGGGRAARGPAGVAGNL